MVGRSGKQCRERWFNSLNPYVKKGSWSEYEDYIIFTRFNQFGSKWAKIASELKGRTENSIKNRFYSTLRRLKCDLEKDTSSEQGIIEKNLTYLLKYFPNALEEKTKIYNEFIKQNPDFLSTIETKPNMNKENESLNIKKESITNINNTINFNINITAPNNKPNNIEELEKVIDKWCNDEIEIGKDDLFENIENKVKSLTGNNGTVSTKQKESNDENNINLLGQLNQLEALLINTKKELINNIEKNYPVCENAVLSNPNLLSCSNFYRSKSDSPIIKEEQNVFNFVNIFKN